MDTSSEKNPESQENILLRIPVLSSYAEGLESHVRERYVKKISVVGVDPAAIPKEQFHSECLPPIEVSDLLSYLVLETSYYTNKQFKAFKRSVQASGVWLRKLGSRSRDSKQDCCCGEGETFATDERSSDRHLDHRRK